MSSEFYIISEDLGLCHRPVARRANSARESEDDADLNERVGSSVMYAQPMRQSCACASRLALSSLRTPSSWVDKNAFQGLGIFGTSIAIPSLFILVKIDILHGFILTSR